MKKLIITLISLLLVITLVGCGNNDESSEVSSEDNNTVDVDENLLTVDITLPESFFESFDTTADDYVKGLEEDEKYQGMFTNVASNDDGSVTITMTRSKYNEFLGEMKKSVNESIEEIVNDKDTYPNVANIIANDDFTSFDITLASDELGFTDSFLAITMYLEGAIYQMFTEDPKMTVTVNYYGASGDLLDSTTLDPDSFSDSE